MKVGLEITDVPEGLLIPIVATLGVVGNLGKKQFLTSYANVKSSHLSQNLKKKTKKQLISEIDFIFQLPYVF